jgi:hypothetical protein
MITNVIGVADTLEEVVAAVAESAAFLACKDVCRPTETPVETTSTIAITQSIATWLEALELYMSTSATGMAGAVGRTNDSVGTWRDNCSNWNTRVTTRRLAVFIRFKNGFGRKNYPNDY